MAVLSALSLLFVAPATAQLQDLLDEPLNSTNANGPSCSAIDDREGGGPQRAGGFHITWTESDSAVEHAAVEQVVIERRVRSLSGSSVSEWFWRARVDTAAGGQEAASSFDDAGVPDGFELDGYRIRLALRDGTETTVPCNPAETGGAFRCMVDFDADGYRVSWKGGPVIAPGETRSHVVERDVNDEDEFFWRGRTESGFFLDTYNRNLPVYRVTIRTDVAGKMPIWGDSTTCELEMAPIGERRPTALGAMVCPVPDGNFVDTWGAPRGGGSRQHQGVDIFAPRGTIVLAPASGEISFGFGDLGGKVYRLEGDNGVYYYGAHLDAFVGANRRVEAGEPVGTVGTTGNAATTPPHLHFQIHPNGRLTNPVNPTPATREACR